MIRTSVVVEVFRIRRPNLFRLSPPPEDVAQALYQAFYDKTLRHVMRMIGDRECAVEATQEAFVRAFERFGTLRDRDKFGAWVASIAVNAANDIMRRRKREMPDIEAVARDGRAPEVVEEIAVAREGAQTIQEAISLLPSQFKSVIILHYVGDLDVASIAKRLGIPEGTVKSRLHRGRAWLRGFIECTEEPAEGGEADGSRQQER